MDVTWAAEEARALKAAARRCDVDAIRELLSAGVNVDYTEPTDRLTALQHLCDVTTSMQGAEDQNACAALLLAHGASPNAGAPGGPAQNFTPLMSAALRGHLEIIRMLLSAGGDVNVIASGASALGMAVFSAAYAQAPTRANRAILEALLRAGADPNPPADLGRTVMQMSIMHAQRRYWPLLLRAGAILPATDDGPDGNTSYYDLHRAHPYLLKIDAAGGFKAYEKAHRTKLLATFTPKFTHLVPPELVPIIVEFSFHVGFY